MLYAVSVHCDNAACQRCAVCESFVYCRAGFCVEYHTSYVGRQLTGRYLHTRQSVDELSFVALRVFCLHYFNGYHFGVRKKLLQLFRRIELIVFYRDICASHFKSF